MKWISAVLILVLLAGCSLKSIRQVWVGYSINDVKSSKYKEVQSFDMSSSDCIDKIKDALKNMNAIVREDRKKQYIVADNFQKVFRSAIDTTQVGILVTPKGADKCQVEIASENIDLAVFVSKEIVNNLKPKQEPAATK